MTRLLSVLLTACGFATVLAGAQPAFAQTAARSANSSQHLSTHWEELTAADFRTAIAQSGGTCILPFGILEKHGPQLPLGTDLINVRFASLAAAADEYAVVFPEYYFGQIFEAKHEPGTIAYSADLQMRLLQETTDEMARNVCKKILIVNGHGGNEHLLPFFAQAQLDKPHDYVVYVQWGHEIPAGGPARKPLWICTRAKQKRRGRWCRARTWCTSTAPPANRAQTRIACISRMTSIPASGGTRAFRIITPETVPRPRSPTAKRT